MLRCELPSLERLQHLLSYDPLTGILTWKDLPEIQGKVRGRLAGGLTAKGYLTIQIDGLRYMVHRICWKMYHGVEPPLQLDHDDRVRHHNWIKNLRPASNGENRVNTVRPVNRSGLPQGVSFVRKTGLYEARVAYQGRRIHIGTNFRTPEDAHQAYLNKRHELYGEFARTT